MKKYIATCDVCGLVLKESNKEIHGQSGVRVTADGSMAGNETCYPMYNNKYVCDVCMNCASKCTWVCIFRKSMNPSKYVNSLDTSTANTNIATNSISIYNS